MLLNKNRTTEQEKHKRRRLAGGNREILTITYIFVALFLALIVYLFVFTQYYSQSIINNSYNKRQDLLEEKVIRGKIYSRNGDVLAYSEQNEEGTVERVYPYADVFAHAVGFRSNGRSGVESIANFSLITSDVPLSEQIKNTLSGEKNPADSVVTTLDVYLQQVAYASMGNRQGAIVATNLNTGEILALVSKPDFDPNEIDRIWDEMNENPENSALLNRATMGLYPPGSTFKIVTALEYMLENPNTDSYEFDCSGSFAYDGSTINCFHGQHHGHVDFTQSFAKSCNSSFANISTTLNRNEFKNTCENLLFNDKLPIPYSYKVSSVPISSKSTSDEVMQTAIGQGKTVISPFHMNLITQAIANKGILMNPYVVSEVISENGDTIKTCEPSEYGRLLPASEASKLCELMREVVLSGTGSKVRDTYGYTAAGKTGSAEFFTADKSQSHAWFTGFAGVDYPEIAVTVLIEAGGSGGEVAAPIAKDVFDAYFGQKL